MFSVFWMKLSLDETRFWTKMFTGRNQVFWMFKCSLDETGVLDVQVFVDEIVICFG